MIASTEPFLDAAEANSSATGLQPGVYNMRLQMSGQAALDLLLHPDTKMVNRVAVPEGQTVAQTLQRLADGTGVPLEEWQAAVADPAALGLPPYANGLLEGFLSRPRTTSTRTTPRSPCSPRWCPAPSRCSTSCTCPRTGDCR